MSNSQNSPEDEGVTRRTFLGGALWVGGVALVASVVYPIVKYLVLPQVFDNPRDEWRGLN